VLWRGVGRDDAVYAAGDLPKARQGISRRAATWADASLWLHIRGSAAQGADTRDPTPHTNMGAVQAMHKLTASALALRVHFHCAMRYRGIWQAALSRA